MDVNVVRALESAEVEAWRDMYAAMPQTFREESGAEILDVDGGTMTRCRSIPFTHFNAALDFGLSHPPAKSQLERIVDLYETAGIGKFVVVQTSTDASAESRALLSGEGFSAKGTWERVVGKSGQMQAPAPVAGETRLVSAASGAEWARFLSRSYGLPTEPWLVSLVERPRWTHAVLTRNGAIVAARSMYVSVTGWAWLGVEAPVPGVMAPSFDDDSAVTWALVQAGIEQHADGFVADIEAPSPDRNTRAYQTWESLGFEWPYSRLLYARAALNDR